MTTIISQRAVDKIVGYEVSSRAYYEKKLQRPEWPGGASGVTIGIGYDLGYATTAKIEADWGNKVSPNMLTALKSCSGVTGQRAQSLCLVVRSQILIPWADAMEVFLHRDVPDWTNKVCSLVPLADQLPPDSLGALVSLAYNRGASFNAAGDRYREMRDIKAHTASRRWTLDPDDIRSMKRLWPTVAGLRKRRDDEAALFQAGLSASLSIPAPLPPTEHTINETPPTLPQDKTATASAGTVGGGGTVAAGTAAVNAGLPVWAIVLIVAVCVAGTALLIYGTRKWQQSTPVLARQKDPADVGQNS